MIIALATVALAYDVSPALFVPSTAPGSNEADVQLGVAFESLGAIQTGGTHLTGTVRLDRLAFGVSAGAGPGYPYVASGWAGVALVDAKRVRLQVFGEVGRVLRPGVSFAAQTRGGGIGDHGFLFDVAWGPAWAVDRITGNAWAGPFDALGSMPEGGVSMALHPAGTQYLRVGFVGLIPAVSYRLDLRKERRSGFVLESAMGTNIHSGLATLSVGWSAGPRPARSTLSGQ